MKDLGKNRRRFPRHAVAMSVGLKEKGGLRQYESLDVSRHGAFLLCDDPKALRQLLQLEFQPPGFPLIHVMAKVVRVVEPGNEYGFLPGMGVDFFALSNEAKDAWDRFVFSLAKDRDSVLDMAKNYCRKQPREASSPGTSSDDLSCALTPSHPNASTCCQQTNFILRLKNKRELRDFYDLNLISGGMFLRTSFAQKPGDSLSLTLVSSDTEQEFGLSARVISNQEENEEQRLGYWLALEILDDSRGASLLEFIETGEEIMLSEEEEEEILDDFDDESWTTQQSAWALNEQGKQVLFAKNPGPAEAIKRFRQAIELDKSYLPAHRGECWCLSLLERHEEAMSKLRAIQALRKELHRGLDRFAH